VSGRIIRTIFAAALPPIVMAASAFAEEGRLGMAKETEINFQPPATDIMEQVVGLHTDIFYIITAIVALVLLLLLWIIIRYNKKANPVPSKVAHNTPLEIVWTVVPVLILVYIGYFSVKLLYEQDVIPEADMVIKVTGHQWYWTYEYPDLGLTFDATMLPEDYFKPGLSPAVAAERDAAVAELRQVLSLPENPKIFRLLDTDRRVVVPIDTTVKVIVTADDVIHAWTIPAFGFKIDATPGRLNETWFRARELGTFYGQCSELCGIRHAYMPIVVQVVSQKDFELWQTKARFFYASGGAPEGTSVASNAADAKN
jgi:cytochrome c oxidase subunit II